MTATTAWFHKSREKSPTPADVLGQATECLDRGATREDAWLLYLASGLLPANPKRYGITSELQVRLTPYQLHLATRAGRRLHRRGMGQDSARR